MAPTATPSAPLPDRTQIHQSAHAVHAVHSLLSSHSAALAALAQLRRKISKQLLSLSEIKHISATPCQALRTAATVWDALGEADHRCSKIWDKETENLGTEMSKWFKKVTKEEKAHDDVVAQCNNRIKKAGQQYEKRLKKPDPATAAADRANYIALLEELGKSMKDASETHAASQASQHNAALLSFSAATSRLAEAEWARVLDSLKGVCGLVGDLSAGRAACEGGWSEAGGVRALQGAKTNSSADAPEVDGNQARAFLRSTTPTYGVGVDGPIASPTLRPPSPSARGPGQASTPAQSPSVSPLPSPRSDMSDRPFLLPSDDKNRHSTLEPVEALPSVSDGGSGDEGSKDVRIQTNQAKGSQDFVTSPSTPPSSVPRRYSAQDVPARNLSSTISSGLSSDSGSFVTSSRPTGQSQGATPAVSNPVSPTYDEAMRSPSPKAALTAASVANFGKRLDRKDTVDSIASERSYVARMRERYTAIKAEEASSASPPSRSPPPPPRPTPPRSMTMPDAHLPSTPQSPFRARAEYKGLGEIGRLANVGSNGVDQHGDLVQSVVSGRPTAANGEDQSLLAPRPSRRVFFELSDRALALAQQDGQLDYNPWDEQSRAASLVPPTTAPSSPGSVAGRNPAHSPACGCWTCSARHYATPTTPTPEIDKGRGGEKRPGWLGKGLRRLSVPVFDGREKTIGTKGGSDDEGRRRS